MPKLINIIPNSSFEEFDYNDSKQRCIKSWSVTKESQINHMSSCHMTHSMFLKANGDDGGSLLLTTLKKYKEDEDYNYNPKHKYYFRVMCKLPDNATVSDNINITLWRTPLTSLFYTMELELTVNEYKDWNYYSEIITLENNTDELYVNAQLSCKQSTKNNSNNRCAIDSMLLIDLTECFGDNCEPTKKWCDDNIPYFENEYKIDLSPIEMEFVYHDQFIYDKNNKRYYTVQKKPQISFVLKNVGNKRIEDVLEYAFISFSGSNYPYSDRVEDWTLYNKNVSQLKIERKNDDIYCTYNNDRFEFSYINQRDIFRLTVRLDNGLTFEDELTLYYVGNYEYLACELNPIKTSVNSKYVRKLSGTISGFLNDTYKGLDMLFFNVPMDIDLFINGIKTSPVNIIESTNKYIAFEKEIYLSDGENTVDVVVTDICGNQKIFNLDKINIEVMPKIPEKKDLLTNFIADDDLKISLKLGNADLKYANKNAGLEKEVIIDTSVDSHYFELTGENANLYRISKDNIPKIQGDIIRRPLSVVFDYVEKIYDGTNDISHEIRKLKLDDGYYLKDVHEEYGDYSNTGLVRSVRERKITSDVILKQNEIINKEYYIIDKPNVDLSGVYINIDGIEGYSLPYADNAAIFIFENNELSKMFEAIILEKANNHTKLRFIMQENTLSLYRVKNSLILKYNYSIDSNDEYVTYTNSDIGTIQVDFEKAFFKTKDVTDTVQSIACNDIKFIGDVLGDTSMNYQIANYMATGKILKRTIYPHINCLNKVYDGSSVIPFEMDKIYYNGLENAIEGDDIYIDNTFEGDRNSDTHIFTKHGSTICVVENPDVGENKPVMLNSLFLEGYDAKNYKLGDVISNFKTNISKRPISITINKLHLIRTNESWEVEYTITNDIKSDKLTMIYNTHDEMDIKVYGGIDNYGNSIHENYENYVDIISMFSPFNTVLDDTQTPYIESKDKQYKLYSGCKVMVTNINLNPLNDKLKNYTVLNTKCEIEIEII